MDLKSILKQLKLNESGISMALGALVIIVVGILVVNYFKGQGGSLIPGLTDTNEESSLPENAYIVKEGDTLWSIAEEQYGSGFEWTKIADANNIGDPYEIEKGQVITLPDVESVAKNDEQEVGASPEAAISQETQSSEVGSTSDATVTTQNTPDQISSTSYTVVHGDNLWDIAVRAYGDGYKWVEIAKENDLVHPNIIHTGNVLVLPR